MKAMQVTDELFTHPLPADKYRQQTDPVLQLDNVNVSFDGFRALTDLSLRIGVGELRCVIGPNGAGKTTLMDVITGKTRPDSGRVFYDQTVDLTRLAPMQIAHAGIGRKFQKPTVFEALTVFENLEIAQKTRKSVWACLRARLSSEQRDRIDEMLKTLRLGHERHRPAGLLSHGQKQFLEIGMHAGAGAAPAAARRAGGRHDRRRNRLHRRTVPRAGGQAFADGGGTRYGICGDHRRSRDGAASGAGAGGRLAGAGAGR